MREKIPFYILFQEQKSTKYLILTSKRSKLTTIYLVIVFLQTTDDIKEKVRISRKDFMIYITI